MPIINAATVGVDFSAENFIVIDGIHITNGTNNFLLSAGSDNNTITNCIGEDAGARGVSLSSSDDVVISGNTFTSSGDISLNISTTVNLILENNIIENCIGNCIVLSGSTNGIIKNNYIDGSTEEQLYVRGTTTGNIFSGNIFANTSDAYTVRLRDSGIVGNMFYGNVWYLGGIGIATTSPVGSGTIFKNNIMYKTTTSDFLLFPSGSTANVEIENNLYFSTAASETTNMFTWDGTTTIGFDDWQALGNDNGTGTFGYYSDPLFDNATAGDFWTDNESSDIFENGQGITNYNDRIEFDSIFGAGGSVTTTTQADTIGAFEFVSAGGGSGVHLGPITLENILLENLCIGNCP
jgi:parallel beta-helix repeat protein